MLPVLNPKMAQRGREFHTWIALCLGLGVRRYVELGAWKGGSANFAKEAGVDQVVTIDLAPDRPADLGSEVGYISEDSHTELAALSAFNFLGDFPDAVFVDADHFEDSVRKDFELWWPITKVVFGFHDILLDGVDKLWVEVSKGIRSVEIISRDELSEKEYHDNKTTPWGGIGVLFKEQ